MCVICSKLINHKITLDEGKDFAFKMLPSTDGHYWKLYKSIRDFDIGKISEALDEGTKDEQTA